MKNKIGIPTPTVVVRRAPGDPFSGLSMSVRHPLGVKLDFETGPVRAISDGVEQGFGTHIVRHTERRGFEVLERTPNGVIKRSPTRNERSVFVANVLEAGSEHAGHPQMRHIEHHMNRHFDDFEPLD